MKIIYQLLNYTNTTVALEKVKTAGIDRMALNGFTLGLRFFETIIEYILAYAIVKFIQFIFSLLIGTSINDVNMVYYVLPLLILAEIGFSKLDYKTFLNLIHFVVRATVKFLVIWGIDKLVIIVFL